MIVINFKTYESGIGKSGEKIVTALKNVEGKTGVKAVAVVQAVDIKQFSRLGVEIWAQHVDPVEPGKYSGHVTVEAIKDAGASGSLLNHPERPMKFSDVKEAVTRLTKAKLKSCVVATSIEMVKTVAKLKPSYISFEKTETIGGTKSSIELFADEVAEAANIYPNLFVGGGFGTKQDIKAIKKVGAKGVLSASAVMCTDNPEKVLTEYAEGFLE